MNAKPNSTMQTASPYPFSASLSSSIHQGVSGRRAAFIEEGFLCSRRECRVYRYLSYRCSGWKADTVSPANPPYQLVRDCVRISCCVGSASALFDVVKGLSHGIADLSLGNTSDQSTPIPDARRAV
jgi:hypothetical protein